MLMGSEAFLRWRYSRKKVLVQKMALKNDATMPMIERSTLIP